MLLRRRHLRTTLYGWANKKQSSCRGWKTSIKNEDFYENGTFNPKSDLQKWIFAWIHRILYKNGNLKGVGEWKGNKLNGRYEDYYENGQLRKKTTMIDNKMNGTN